MRWARNDRPWVSYLSLASIQNAGTQTWNQFMASFHSENDTSYSKLGFQIPFFKFSESEMMSPFSNGICGDMGNNGMFKFCKSHFFNCSESEMMSPFSNGICGDMGNNGMFKFCKSHFFKCSESEMMSPFSNGICGDMGNNGMFKFCKSHFFKCSESEDLSHFSNGTCFQWDFNRRSSLKMPHDLLFQGHYNPIPRSHSTPPFYDPKKMWTFLTSTMVSFLGLFSTWWFIPLGKWVISPDISGHCPHLSHL